MTKKNSTELPKIERDWFDCIDSGWHFLADSEFPSWPAYDFEPWTYLKPKDDYDYLNDHNDAC